jgi:hypothetical protein
VPRDAASLQREVGVFRDDARLVEHQPSKVRGRWRAQAKNSARTRVRTWWRISVGWGRLMKGGDPSDGAARTGLRTHTAGLQRSTVVGVPLPDGRPWLQARSARGFACEQDARDALERELDRVRREGRISRSLTLAELVETYLAQHDVQPVTIEKLRYLLGKATAVFGDRRIGELTSQEIAAWRMRLSPGYRFEATQAVGAGASPRGGVGDTGRPEEPGARSTDVPRRSGSGRGQR